MRPKRAIAYAALGLGATAAANRALAARAGDLEAPLPGEQATYRWRGFDVAYTEAGDPADPDLLLLHGASAAVSSHVFAPAVDHLAEEYHVVAPDLPGYGHSDRPPLAYSASFYATFVADFAADLVEDAVCVASGLTGAYAASAARGGAAGAFDRLVLICPTGRPIGTRRVWLRSLLRSPVVGEGLFNLVVSRPSIRYFEAEHGFYDLSALPPGRVEYLWRSAHRPGARFAPASFFGGFLDLDDDLGEVLAAVDAPVTLVWGREATLVPLREGRELAEAGDARLVVFDRAKLLPHAEHPEAFAEVVAGRPRQAAPA